MAVILKRVVLGIAAFLLLAILIAWLALRSDRVQRALLGKASAALESSLGLTLEADAVRLRALRGAVELEGVTVRNRAGGTLAAADRAAATVRLAALLRGRVVAPEIVLDRLRVDLGELPASEPEAPAEPAATGGLAVEILSLRVRAGELAGLPLPAASEAWVSAGTIGGIELRGSLIGGELRVDVESASLDLARPEAEPVVVAVEGSVSGPLAGAYELSGVRLSGREIDLALSGAIGLSEEQPMRLAFDGWLDAGRLSGADREARVSTAGELDVRAGRGTIDLAAPRIPAELVERWLEPELAARLELAGSAVAVEAELRLGPDRLDRIGGRVAGAWTRGDAVLAELESTPEIDASARAGRIPFELEVAPGAAGRRRASGALSFADWQDFESAAIEAGRVDLQLPDLGAALATLRRLAPDQTAALPAGLGGSLDLDASVSGALRRPRVDLEADWRPGRDSSLRLSAAGEPLELRGRVEAQASRLALDALGAGLAGLVDGRLALALDGARRSGSFDLEARGLAVGELSGLDVAGAGELEGDSLRLSTLTADWNGHRLETVARLDLTRDGLSFAAESLTLDGVTGELTVDVPGVLIGELPVALRPEWTTPAARARRVRVAWALPESDLAGPLGLGDAALRIASSGDVWIDLERPAASSGEARVSTASWSAGERRLAISEPLELLLSDARLSVPRLALAGPESRLDGTLEIDLSTAWEAGDGWPSAIARAELRSEGEIGADWLGQALGLQPGGGESLAFDADLAGDPAAVGGRLLVAGAGSRVEARGAADLDLDRFAEGWQAAVAAVDLGASGSVSARLVGGLLGLESGAAAGELGDAALDLEIELAGGLEELRGRVRVDGPDAEWLLGEADAVRVAAPRLELRLAERAVTLDEVGVELNGEPLTGSGAGRLDGERLEIDRLDLAFAGIAGRWSASVPFAGGEAAAPASAELRIEWSIPEAALEPALELLELIRPGDTIRAGSTGRLRLVPGQLAQAAGAVEISGFDWLSAGRRTTSDGPIRLRLADGRLTLEPLELLSQDQRFELRGAADLAGSWSPGAGAAGLVENLELRGSGTLLTSLLNPFLGGGVAEGYLGIDLEAVGPPGALRGRLAVAGSEATLTYARPYATRLSEPNLELTFEPGGVARLTGDVSLNEGRVTLSGDAGEEGSIELEAGLNGVRYRLDYGLLVLLNGDLSLLRSSNGAWALGGTIVVDNGVLTRDIDVDLDFVLALLAPVDLTSTEQSPLEAVALDLDLTTVEGVRVKNNAADLVVRWDPVRIGGTLAAPVLDGRFEIDAGGRVRAFGQTVRIDSASIDYPGVADLPATLEFSTTSSFEDPTIAGLSADDPFASERDATDGEPDRLAAAAAGLGTFYGERIASRLTGGLTGASVSLQPLLIFGEADPGTRLTVTQDVSPQVALAASVDLRQAEAQTYLLDVHRLEALPGLNAQVFTTDQASEGVALRQRVLLGPGGARRSSGPKIRKIRYQLPEGVSKRRVKRVLGLRKGDRLADGAAFAAEVEVIEALRRRGYSDARATVAVEPVDPAHGGEPDAVELVVSARPGPHAAFVFEGAKLSKPLRRTIVDLYRPDYYESVALEEMAAETRRALRSLGYLDPSVDVAVELLDPEDPSGDRVVTVSMIGGERIDLERIRFVPLPADEAALLETRFSRPVRRVELAAGLPDADRRVEQMLRYLGYEDPRVASRRLSADGEELEVVVETGERPRVASVDLAGVEPGEAERLAGLIELRPGDPLRSDRVAGAAVTLRDDLRSRGYSDAAVEPHVAPAAADPERLADVRFEIERGTQYFVGAVSFDGLASTREGYARKVAKLPPSTDYSQESVLEARRRLRQTQLFETVTPDVVRAPGGAVRVGFDVRERQRFEFAYGVRWDSEEDLGLLAEAIDRNALGQAWTLGLRAQWSEDDQSLRFFAGLPRLFDAHSSLSFFTSIREQTETEVNLFTETLENTLQLSYEFSRRLTGRLYGRLTQTHVSEVIPNPRLPFDQKATRPVLGTQLLYDSRRGEVLFHDGLLATGDFSYSDEALGSDFEFVRFYGQLNYFRRLSRASARSLVWAQSIRIGLAKAFNQDLIPQDRFFAGGEFSVRGYQTESLGPLERFAPIPAGGDALLVLNQELRWQVSDRFTGVGFVDAGNVWADRADFGFDLATSIGLGLRAATPVGILRLDLAHALDRRPIDPEFKIYFGFGSTF